MFTAEFRDQFDALLRWRRDVRHFKSDPVAPELLDHLLAQAMLAPSVGFSQPWRWVKVETQARRQTILENFSAANLEASTHYEGEQAEHYRRLKLAGLVEAPVHLAVFADLDPVAGSGLGRRTMPETALWSVVMAIHTLWLAARLEGIGLGWVSILDPQAAQRCLEVPDEWSFVAYLCLGWPVEISEQPLLEREHWQERLPLDELVLKR
ncbi:5,6-dimethylbenzimidazole synthase [Bryobacter aggregatus]|uniref:5,6-dimethylbenzimidazole synthase n=1 Tax=Bryobacter aggregatus TaxID=360054 RepID=UPI0004E13DA0|nr:5,6-dimethylbenzimidazole synthase [Bryobacter aggregatus]